MSNNDKPTRKQLFPDIDNVFMTWKLFYIVGLRAKHWWALALSLTTTLSTDGLWVGPPLSEHSESNRIMDSCWPFLAFKCLYLSGVYIFVSGMQKIHSLLRHSFWRRFFVCDFQQYTHIDIPFKLIYVIQPMCVTPPPKLHWPHSFDLLCWCLACRLHLWWST